MRIFVLDDSRARLKTFKQNLITHTVVTVESEEEAKKAIKSNPRFDVWYVDHDLEDVHYSSMTAEFERTGLTFARWACSEALDKLPELVVVHSWNGPGSRNIANEFKRVDVRVVLERFNEDSGLNLRNENG